MARSRSTLNDTPPVPGTFPQRWLVWGLAILITLGVAAALSGELAGDMFRTFIYAVFLVPVVLPAWMVGIALTHPFDARGCFDTSPWPRGLRSLVAVALGLGVIALGTLALGSLHILGQNVWISLILPALLCVAGLGPAVKYLRGTSGGLLRTRAHRGDWVFLVAAVPTAMLLIAATFPPGSLWGATEAHGYDVMEYHLELPREYAQNHSTAPLPHNIYSYFPQNVEMLYTTVQQIAQAAMGGDASSGYVWGAFPAQFLHVLLTLLTAAAIALMPIGGTDRTQPWLHATGRAIAVLFFLGTPWTIVTGSLAYNEMGMMFFGTLALGLSLARPPRPDSAQHGTTGRQTTLARGILIGILLGLAVGCKLTAGIFFALPVAAVIIWRGFTDGGQWRMLGAATAVALLLYSPWAIRAAAYSGGNPVFPLATSLLGRGTWPADLAARFDAGHQPKLKTATGLRPVERAKALANQSIMDGQWAVQPFALLTLLDEHPQPLDPPWKRLNLLVLIVPLAIGGAFVVRAGRTEAGLILTVLVVQVLAWMFTTHLQARFLLPVAVPLALLAGRAAQGLHLSAEGQLVGGLRIATATLVGLQGLCAIFILLPEAGIFGGAVVRNGKTYMPPIGQPFKFVLNVAEVAEPPATAQADALARATPPAPTLLLGDATAWRFEGPVSYFTVFDADPVLDALTHNAPEQATAWMRHAKIEYVWVDWLELARLQDTYGLGLNVPPRATGDTYLTRANQIAEVYAPRLTAAGLEDTHASQQATLTIYRLPRQP